MSFIIKSRDDVIKFALPLYDYLTKNGYLEEAKTLSEFADACFAADAQVTEAHLKAYSAIRQKVRDLPPEYKSALDAALKILSEL